MSSVPTRRELLGWLVAIALVFTFVTVLRPSVAAEGDSAAPTATEEKAPSTGGAPEGHTVNLSSWDTNRVFIATGENFPDALAAAAAAGAWNAPVLMVRQDSVPQAVIDELNRLHPGVIVIAGGSDVVSNGVKSTLEGLAFGPTVVRLQGNTRYETAVEISEGFFPVDIPVVSGYASTDDAPTLNGTGDIGVDDVVLLDLVLEVPDSGILTINAGVETYGGPDTLVRCYLVVNDVQVTGSVRDIEVDNATNSEENCTTQGGFRVPSGGSYTIEFWAVGDSSVLTDGAAMTVLWTDQGSYKDGP